MFPLQLFHLFFTASPAQQPSSEDDGSRFQRGDLLEVPRTLFTHFGIYLGDGRVAHLIPDILPLLCRRQAPAGAAVTNARLVLGVVAKAASVRVDSVADFAYGSPVLVNCTDRACRQPALGGEEVARRAEALLGSTSYSLLWYNCEHYVMHCRYGLAISFQTHKFCTAVRELVCSRTAACLTALLGLGAALYMGSAACLPGATCLLVSFLLWMAC